MRMHPTDAAARGIEHGDVIRVFNERGSLLAGVIVSDQVRPQVVQLSTGAWFDPIETEDGKPFCVHGNPNVLTPRYRHIEPRSGLLRSARAGRGQTLVRRPAANPRLRPARLTATCKALQGSDIG